MNEIIFLSFYTTAAIDASNLQPRKTFSGSNKRMLCKVATFWTCCDLFNGIFNV